MLKALYLKEELGDTAGLKVVPVLKTKQTSLLPFCVSSIGDYDCDENFYVDRSGYDTCLLMYTLSGEGIVKYDGQECLLTQGDAVVIDCRKHQYYATREDRWHFLWLHLEGKCVFDYVDILNENAGLSVFLGNRISFRSIYDKLLTHARRFDAQSELEMSLTVQKLLTNMIQLKNTKIFSELYGNHKNEIENSIAFLKEHFTEDIKVEHLAKRCNLSKYYYIKVFRSYTGHTPYDYLLGQRLQYAQQLLLETKLSVAEIAVNSGFTDSKNFIFNFKKRFCITPLQFRKQKPE